MYHLILFSMMLVLYFIANATLGKASYSTPSLKINLELPERRITNTKTEYTYDHNSNVFPKTERDILEKRTLTPDQQLTQEGLKVYLTAKRLEILKAQREEDSHQVQIEEAMKTIRLAAKARESTYEKRQNVFKQHRRPLSIAQAKQWESWQHISSMKNVDQALKKHIEDMFPKGHKVTASPWGFYVNEIRRLYSTCAAEAMATIYAANAWLLAYYSIEKTFNPLHFGLKIYKGSDLGKEATARFESMDRALQEFSHKHKAIQRVQEVAIHNTDYLGSMKKGGELFYDVLRMSKDRANEMRSNAMRCMITARTMENEIGTHLRGIKLPRTATKFQRTLFRRLSAGAAFLASYRQPVLKDGIDQGQRPATKGKIERFSKEHLGIKTPDEQYFSDGLSEHSYSD